MKKKIIFTSAIIAFITITLFYGISVFATNSKEIEMRNKRGLEVISINDTYSKISTENVAKLNINAKNNIMQIANYYLDKFESEERNMKNIEDMKLEYFHNGLMSRDEVILDNADYSLTLNADTGDLINYSKHMTSFPKCELEREQIAEIANELFEKTELCNTNDYKMIYLEEYDEGIWWVGYAKKYDDLVNIGEIVKFHFVPATKEIWVLGINNLKYDNNEVLISPETAQEIVNNSLVKSTSECLRQNANKNMEICLDIVNPNDFLLEEKLSNDKMYSFAQYMRKAYVCQLNDEANTRIYIDCTTGEIIGGTITWGGEV